MTMESTEARRSLIERLEREAERAPGRYRLKVALLAALGFLVLGGAVLLAFGLSVGLVLLLLAISPILLLKLAKLIWIPIAFGWVLLRSLWIKFAPPEGYRLAPGEAPRLRTEVERLRAATGAPKLDGIVIDADLNAAAASVPRALGLFGHRHYLLLGLPLMQMLDRDQFASVIAHEFGHFGGGHGRFSGWIYHVRSSWYRLLGALQAQRSWANRLFVKFFDWYAPYFNAYSFVLARAQEYEADAAAARVVGNRAAGQALVRVNIGSARLDQDFWPGVQRATRSQPAPPALLYREMGEHLRQAGEEDAVRLQRALSRTPDFDDTHPTLSQRLAALGVAAEDASPPRHSFAEEFLGELLPKLERHFSEQWRDNVQATWEQNYQQNARDEERLAQLEGMAERSAEETVEHARLSEALRPGADALALYRRALERAPEDAFVHFRLGALLIDKLDAAGVAHMERATALDPDCTAAALDHLGWFYRQTGDGAGQDRVSEHWRRLNAQQAQSQQARNEVTARDAFSAHELDAATVDAVRAALVRIGGIGSAWLVRKRIPGDESGPPHFVMLVYWRGMVASQQKKLQAIVDALELPGSFMVFVGENRWRRLERRLRKAAGAPVYRR